MVYARSASARTLGLRILLVLAGSLLMALSAKISVPMIPVPITCQTLAIPLLVALLGRNAATLAVLTYLIEGAAGLPVFAAGTSLAASGGYLLAFPLAAFAIGWLYERGWGRAYLGRLGASFIGGAVILIGGASWLTVFLGLTPQHAIAVGIIPFLLGDALKCALAASLSPVWPTIARRLGIVAKV
jgi:biotin transport system substrate-specific component